MTHLNEGDKAPQFTAKDQNGKKVSLKDYKGRKVVLYFYPEDDTPVCTVQACNYRDNLIMLRKQGYEVVGVSPQGTDSHHSFAQKFKLNFSLLADEKMEIIKAYGVWGPKTLYGRTYEGIHRETFVINENGIIEKIIRRSLSKKATQQVLQ